MARTVLSEKGQVVIPVEIRARLKLEKGDRFEVELDGDRVILKRLPRNPILKLRGILAGTGALEELLRDHELEIQRDEERERHWREERKKRDLRA